MRQPELFEIDLGNRKVHIIKVQRKSVQGRHLHTRGGKNLNKTQAGRAGTKWSLPPIIGSNKLSTGLWKRRKNPYYQPQEGEDQEGWEMLNLPNSIWVERGIQKMKYITWQEYFEIKHHKKPGEYSSTRATWSEMVGNRKFSGSTLENFRYVLKDGTNILDLTREKDQLLYFFALNCPQTFLKNKADRKRYPRASFFIQEVDAPDSEEYESNMEHDEAIVNLMDLNRKAPLDVITKFSVILNVGTSSMNKKSAYNALRDFIMGENQRGAIKTNTQRFNELYKQYKKKGGMARFVKLYELQEMINQRIIIIDNMKYTWLDKKGTDMEILGSSREQVISMLLDETNAHIAQMLEQELKRKMILM